MIWVKDQRKLPTVPATLKGPGSIKASRVPGQFRALAVP
jgi:hypothetical protein